MVLDIFRADPDISGIFEQPSLLPVEDYVLHMALGGHLSLQDVLRFEADQLRRAYNLFIANEHALSETNAALESKVVELESAYFVLEQRTEALFSLQEMGRHSSLPLSWTNSPRRCAAAPRVVRRGPRDPVFSA